MNQLVVMLGVCMGILLAFFVTRGFHDYEYDHIADEDFPTKWYDIKIVKEWEEPFKDEFGYGIYVFIKRPFKSYTLKVERVLATRMNNIFIAMENSINAISTTDIER